MSSLLKKIADFNNLFWAWEKAKNSYRPGDIWFDELEVACFEADLPNNLSLISRDLLKGLYVLDPILPVPYPKAKKENKTLTRQSFWISVRDQVAWLAIVNVIGGLFDSKMPFWSYGNRLYLSVFFENDDTGRPEPKFGYYRNTNKHVFRKWTQSWPLYRRHINLTARLLSKKEKSVLEELEDEEYLMIQRNENLSKNHPVKNAYIETGYWKDNQEQELFWCGLDLEKFYPSIDNGVIIENFKRFLPTEYYSDHFLSLLKAMLDFKIDYSGWSNQELQEIDLDTAAESYPHLPTGLLVAGFLSNVGMLAIDREVSEKLAKNKSIAHFRYVDDHVILSSNFDTLLAWISEYSDILNNSGLGTNFNYAKTEPKDLGIYLNPEEDFRRDSLREDAKASCSLDPDFPTPLMTQTLGKVSRIAGTDFNLLTPEEEKNLVSDVEHLLVTDFPDHELRKDTRVSFAARMLSNMIPRIKLDSSKAYQYHKNIVINKDLIIKYTYMVDNTKESPEQKKIIEELDEFKNVLKINEELFSREMVRLSDEEKKIGQRAIKLLLKSVNDNHDKVRLWGRLLEFYQKTGASSPISVFEQLLQLKVKQVSNELSISFLRSLILQVTSNLLLDSIKILHSQRYSLRRKQKTLMFLKHILNDAFLRNQMSFLPKNVKNFEAVSWKLFQFSAGTTVFILNEHFTKHGWEKKVGIIDRYKLINWHNPGSFFNNTKFSMGSWIWWLYNRIPEISTGMPFLWDKVSRHLDVNLNIDLNVLLLYPKEVPEQVLSSLDKLDNKDLKENEGLQFDIYKALIDKNQPSTYSFLKKIASKQTQFQQSVTLYDWIEWTNRMTALSSAENSSDFDPRLGEWMALELIRQVAVDLQKRLNESPFNSGYKSVDYFRYIHPHNLKLPSKWLDTENILSWEGLREKLAAGRVEFRGRDEWIEENRYIPFFGLDPENRAQAIFTGLGSLLVNLLSKNADLPPKWNPLGLQQGWLELAKYKLRKLALSTTTRDIINACFSNRNIETKFQKRMDLNFGFSFDEDTKYDPPQFNYIDDFLKHINYALLCLKKQQLSVSNHRPRQLTPISLIRLKATEYQDLIQKEEIN